MTHVPGAPSGAPIRSGERSLCGNLGGAGESRCLRTNTVPQQGGHHSARREVHRTALAPCRGATQITFVYRSTHSGGGGRLVDVTTRPSYQTVSDLRRGHADGPPVAAARAGPPTVDPQRCVARWPAVLLLGTASHRPRTPPTEGANSGARARDGRSDIGRHPAGVVAVVGGGKHLRRRGARRERGTRNQAAQRTGSLRCCRNTVLAYPERTRRRQCPPCRAATSGRTKPPLCRCWCCGELVREDAPGVVRCHKTLCPECAGHLADQFRTLASVEESG